MPHAPRPKFAKTGRTGPAVQDNPVYAAMVESLDEGVGRVCRSSTSSGSTDRTIVIFTSDNGGLVDGRRHRRPSNAPLRAARAGSTRAASACR